MCSDLCYTNIYPQNNIKIILPLTQYLSRNSAGDALFGYTGFLSSLTDNRQTNATSDTLPNVRRRSRHGKV